MDAGVANQESDCRCGQSRANEMRLNAGETEGGLKEVWPGWEVRKWGI